MDSILAYCIDKEESEKHSTLVLRLVEGERSGCQLIGEKPYRPLSSAVLRKLASSSPVDQQAVDFLIKSELRYLHASLGRHVQETSCQFNITRVSANQSIEALKLLAATGNLFFKGRSIVADFYGKVALSFLVEALSANKIKVAGILKWGSHEVSISDCDFIGQGDSFWFIKGISLKVIETDVSWNEIKRLYQEDPLILEGKSKERFLQEEHAHIVKIEKAPPPCHASPILVLKDRVGAFANLWVDYGEGMRIPFHDKYVQASLRQTTLEQEWENDLLETDYQKKIVDTSHYYCPVDRVFKSLVFLLEIGWEVIDWKGNRVLRQEELNLQIGEEKDQIIIKGKVRYKDFEADLSNVVGAFNRRDRFVQIGPQAVGLLPDSWERSGLQTLVEEGELVGEGVKVKKNQLGVLGELFTDKAHLDVAPSLAELCHRMNGFTTIKKAEIGNLFSGVLRPYQQAGVDWLSFLWDCGFHGLLADDMGLGKTVQIIALFSRLPMDKPHMILMPMSLLFNWKREIEKFLPGIEPYVHHGASRLKDRCALTKQRIILTSYATLRQDLPLFEGLDCHTLVLDEAQAIKNSSTQISQAVRSLNARLRISITGTPIENHLQELWSHFHFLIPDLLGDGPTFAIELESSRSDPRFLQRIKKKIRPFLLRRRKEEVAQELPKRIDQVVWVDMGVGERRIYENFLSGFRQGILKKVELEGSGKHRMEVLEAILRLRQVCCHPFLVGEEGRTSAKLEALMSDIETAVAEGKKILVYSQFTSMLRLIAKAIQQRGWSYAYLDGQTEDREKAVAMFQEDSTVPLFLISLKAGGVGLNLTAADYVFLFDPWWNEAVEEQAISRAHRIGRDRTVIAKRYVTVESVEEKMMKLKAAKRKLVEDILDEEALSMALTMDDLRALLT